jgi:hypothetical protein
MSWGVSTQGSIPDVKAELERQFSHPLADAPAGLPDEGERETVRRIRDTIFQCLETFDPDKTVRVSANGHMRFDNWDSKSGACQEVNVSIQPGVS